MMEQTNWLFIIVSFFSLLGFLTAAILFFMNRNQAVAPRVLALVLFCICYGQLGYGLYISKEFLNYPHLWRTPAFFSLCIAPLTYIYVRSVLEQEYRLRRSDFLFIVPAVLYSIQLIPFYLLPASHKLVYIKGAIESKAFGIRETEGLLPPGVAFFFRMTYNFGIVGYTFFILRKWKQSERGQLLDIKENKAIYSWLVYLTTMLFLCFGSLILGSFMHLVSHQFDKIRFSTVTATLTICFICIYLYIRPELLYGLRGWIVPKPVNKPDPQIQDLHQTAALSKRNIISMDQGAAYKALIENHFQEKRPFIKPRYSVKDLSAELDVPSYLLSTFINQEYGKNFNEFVNDKRVDFLKDLIRQEPKHLEFTLEAIGQLGGFNSRSAFTEAVKRKTGLTPSEVFQKKDHD